MSKPPIRVLCVGAGHMGRSHALAYHKLPGFRIVGLVTRSAGSRAKLNAELGGGYPEYGDFHAALKATKPDAVSISSYPDTHAEYAVAALDAGCHVFVEKPLAVTVAEAEQIVAKARANGTPVWYLRAENEGHGFARKENADFQFYATILFMRETILK